MPEVVERLKAGYDDWFDDVSASRGFEAVRFVIGSNQQQRVTLTRQDWRMETPDGWGRDEKVLGKWGSRGRLGRTVRRGGDLCQSSPSCGDRYDCVSRSGKSLSR